MEGGNAQLEAPSRRFDDTADVLKGTVTGVADQTVFISGIHSIASAKPASPATQ